MPAGRPKKIETPEELHALFEEYKLWVKQNPYLFHDFVGKDAVEVWKKKQRPLTFSGFEGWLCARDVVYHLGNYEHNTDGSYEEFLPIVRAIKRQCSADIIDGAMAGVYSHNIAARLEGLADKKEVEKRKVTVSFKDAG